MFILTSAKDQIVIVLSFFFFSKLTTLHQNLLPPKQPNLHFCLHLMELPAINKKKQPILKKKYISTNQVSRKDLVASQRVSMAASFYYFCSCCPESSAVTS